MLPRPASSTAAGPNSILDAATKPPPHRSGLQTPSNSATHLVRHRSTPHLRQQRPTRHHQLKTPRLGEDRLAYLVSPGAKRLGLHQSQVVWRYDSLRPNEDGLRTIRRSAFPYYQRRADLACSWRRYCRTPARSRDEHSEVKYSLGITSESRNGLRIALSTIHPGLYKRQVGGT